MSDAQQNEAPGVSRIAISVVCGHLAFARYPVLVGHYDGDTFAGTEALLDQALRGGLTLRRRLSLYPGPLGSNAVLLNGDARPPGAVVVGLGEPASLSSGALRRTLRQGMLAYAAQAADGAAGETGLNLSALLIGAGEGGLDQPSCVRALLLALKEAHATLRKVELPARFLAIELVELYADRANGALRAVRNALSADPALGALFDADGDVECASEKYGRRSAPVRADPSWWQPIQVTMSGSRVERSLNFTIGGGLARAEARTLAANLDIVETLVRKATRARTNDESVTSPGRTLFELLWPASLKDQSADERSRRLILDERSANFPWELLDDRRPWQCDDGLDAGDTGDIPEEGPAPPAIEPPSVRAGMVRQLLQTRFREGIVTPRGKPKALIVSRGAVDGFDLLPKAEEEGRALNGRLDGRYQVTWLKNNARADEIFRALFTEAWEIVHISAHGLLNQLFAGSDGEKRLATGIVLGRGVLLAPSDLAQLPVSPGIVFVNCCYQGVADPNGETREAEEARQSRLSDRPDFAACVAVELIKLGARCVIAAGWAVNDEAAAAFSDAFYRQILDGAPFGEATRLARKRVYEGFPDSNTWGAFQCYGDPDYRLRLDSRPRTGSDPKSFVAISDAIDAIQQIRDELNIGVERDANGLRKRLLGIEEEARNRDANKRASARKWLKSAELRVALGEAWAELGQPDDLGNAILAYSAAVEGVDTQFKVRAIEQLQNLKVRAAVKAMRALPPEQRRPAETARTIRDAMTAIESLMTLLKPTSERLALMGSCWKRLAQVEPEDEARAAALAKMASFYDLAFAEDKKNGRDDKYPVLMACSARLCAAVRTGTDCETVALKIEEMIVAEPSCEAGFWELVNWADAKLGNAILQAQDRRDDLPALLEAYTRAWRHLGSPWKLSSVIEQLEFYEDVLASGAEQTEPRRRNILRLVEALKSGLSALIPDESQRRQAD